MRLAQALAESAARPLQYGQLDCCLFAANIVLAITGRDPALDLRGQYASEREAYDLMRQRFGGGIETTVAALAQRAGFTEIPPALAQRGDVVLAGRRRQCAAGVVDTSGRKIALFPRRLVLVPAAQARRAWRV